MATINEVIERVGRTKPNAIDDRDKARWLIQLDGRLFEEMVKWDKPDAEVVKEYPEDGDKELLASGPYEDLYDFYLTAMVSLAMRENADYGNNIDLYNARMTEFQSTWRRDHQAFRKKVIRNVMR